MHSIVEFATGAQAPHERPTFGVANTAVGPATLVWDALGIRELSFERAERNRSGQQTVSDVLWVRDDKQAAELLSAVFDRRRLSLPVVLCGTAFQRQVWRELMALPFGHTVSYGELARRLGRPTAARAVGSAVGANKLGFLVPCHRVVRQDRLIGQFRWGSDVKARLLAWEAKQTHA